MLNVSNKFNVIISNKTIKLIRKLVADFEKTLLKKLLTLVCKISVKQCFYFCLLFSQITLRSLVSFGAEKVGL